MPAEWPGGAGVSGAGTGVTSTVRFRTETGWQPVSSSAPPARRSAAAGRKKCADDTGFNGKANTMGLDAQAPPLLEETFAS